MVRLSGLLGFVLALGSGPAVAQSISIDSPSAAEGAAGTTTPLVFTVTLSSEPSDEVTVGYAVGGTATDGEDYTVPAPGGRLRFGAGETSKTITFTVNGDRRAEDDETVVVTLSGPTGGAVIGSGTGAGLIVNDDPSPVLSIDSPVAVEGRRWERTPLVFTVTLDRASDREVTVGYAVGGTAKEGKDYETPDSGGRLRSGGAGTTPPLVFTVPLERTSDREVAAEYWSYRDSVSAHPEWNRNPSSIGRDTLTFAPGDTSKTIEVTVHGDGDGEVEGNELVLIEIGNPTGGARIGTRLGTGTIVDHGGPRFWSPPRPAGTYEGPSGSSSLLAFPVMLSPAMSGTVTVDYAVTGGGARAGVDYRAVAPGTLTFAPGETLKTIEVTVHGDDLYEHSKSETVEIGLSNPTDGVRIAESDRKLVRTIWDDDPLELLIDSPSAAEGAPGATTSLVFTATLNRATEVTRTVEYWARGGTAEAGRDHGLVAPGRVVFEAGDTEKTVEVEVHGDDLIEGDETVELRFQLSSSEIRVGTGKILDDDGSRLSIDSPVVVEGPSASASSLAFTVELSPAAAGTVTVGYAVAGVGTATSGDDFEAVAPGTLEFAPGDTLKTIEVVVRGDSRPEPDETVKVALSEPTGRALIRTGEGTGVIKDDDDFTLSIDSPVAVEGAAGTTTPLVFTVALASEPPAEMTVGYRVAPGGSAEEGDDYGAVAPGTLRFGAGEAARTITVEVNDDSLPEPDETVVVELFNPGGGARIGTGTGTGTIGDDDRPPVLSIDSPVVAEGTKGERPPLVFTVTLDRASDREVTVGYWQAGGTADGARDRVEGRFSDYGPIAGGTLRFAPGDTSRTITVLVNGDVYIENDETVVVQLAAPTGGARIGTGRGTGTIRNDDSPAFWITDVAPQVQEGSATSSRLLEFPVTRIERKGIPDTVTVDYVVVAGTATAGADYQAVSGTLTFAPDEFLKTIEVPINGDGIVEEDEWVLVELLNPTGWSRIRRNVQKGWIRDDDVLRPLIGPGPETAEGAAD